ncbi:MAG: hypothetical protein PWQ06_1970 [Anaerophaga sp.]|nr:hypothetical protein [Anaerophaga sp.]
MELKIVFYIFVVVDTTIISFKKAYKYRLNEAKIYFERIVVCAINCENN